MDDTRMDGISQKSINGNDVRELIFDLLAYYDSNALKETLN